MNFFEKLLGLKPTANAQGEFSFSTEQFDKLDTALTALVSKVDEMTVAAQATSENVSELHAAIQAHEQRLNKIAEKPASSPSASIVEPNPIPSTPTVERSAADIEIGNALKEGFVSISL